MAVSPDLVEAVDRHKPWAGIPRDSTGIIDLNKIYGQPPPKTKKTHLLEPVDPDLGFRKPEDVLSGELVPINQLTVDVFETLKGLGLQASSSGHPRVESIRRVVQPLTKIFIPIIPSFFQSHH